MCTLSERATEGARGDRQRQDGPLQDVDRRRLEVQARGTTPLLVYT